MFIDQSMAQGNQKKIAETPTSGLKIAEKVASKELGEKSLSFILRLFVGKPPPPEKRVDRLPIGPSQRLKSLNASASPIVPSGNHEGPAGSRKCGGHVIITIDPTGAPCNPSRPWLPLIELGPIHSFAAFARN